MRGLATCCIVVSAGLHVAAWLLLDFRGDAAQPVTVSLSLRTEIETAAPEAATAAPALRPAVTPDRESKKDEVAAWRTPAEAAPTKPAPAVHAAAEPAPEPA